MAGLKFKAMFAQFDQNNPESVFQDP